MPNKGVKSLKINPDTWNYRPILGKQEGAPVNQN